MILLPSNLLILYDPLQSHRHSVHSNVCDDNHMTIFAGDKVSDVDKNGLKPQNSEGWEASYVVIRIIDGTTSCDFSMATVTVVTEPLIRKSAIGDFPNQFHLQSSVITLFPNSILILSSHLIGLPNGALTTLLPHLKSARISCLL